MVVATLIQTYFLLKRILLAKAPPIDQGVHQMKRHQLSAILVCIAMVAIFFSYRHTHRPPTTTYPAFDIAGTHLTDVTTFLSQIKQAVKAKNPQSITHLISFPLRVNQGSRLHTLIKTPLQFIKNYHQIFTAKIIRIIGQQEIEKLFVNSQGIMFGQGELWIRATDHSKYPLQIFVINLQTPNTTANSH